MKRNTFQGNETAGLLRTAPGGLALLIQNAPTQKIDGSTPLGGQEKI
jgi:hypothetical protein